MSANVFISYSSEDRDRVLPIADMLNVAGYSVWVDKQVLKPGVNWLDELGKALDACQVLMLMITEHSLESKFVQKELNFAINNNKAILPIKLEDIAMTPAFDLQLGGIEHLNLFQVTGQNIRQYVVPALQGLGIPQQIDDPTFVANAPIEQVTAPQSLPPQPVAKAPTQPIGTAHALVVGVSRYEDPTIPDLKYAASDAEKLYETLVNKAGFSAEHVTLLTDDKARLSTILMALDDLQAADENDLVLFYFAGHGRADIRSEDGQQRDDLVWKYLVTHDANNKNLMRTALSWDTMRGAFQNLYARNHIYLLDSCYSGIGDRSLPVPSTRGELSEPDWAELVGEDRVMLAACQANEMAYEYDDVTSGLFTHFLIKGLGGEAATAEGGTVYIDRLESYLQQQIPPIAKRQFGGQQTPVLYGSYSRPMPLTFVGQKNPLEKAQIFYDTQEYQKAIDLLRDYLPTAGKNVAEVYYQLGRNLAQLGELGKAISCFEAAADRCEFDDALQPRAYVGLGEALLHRGDFDEAIEAFQDAVQLDPRYGKQLQNLQRNIAKTIRADTPEAPLQCLRVARVACLQEDQGKITQQYALMGIEQWPSHTLDALKEHLQRGDLLSALWANEKIRLAYETRYDQHSRYLELLQAGEDALDNGNLLLARERFGQCLALEPNSERPTQALAEIGQRQSAVAHLLNKARSQIAARNLEQGQDLLDEAEVQDTSALEINTLRDLLEQAFADRATADELVHQATARHHAGETREAIAALRQALELEPGHSVATELLAALEQRLQDHNEGRRLAAEATKRDNGSNFHQVLALLKEAFALDPDQPGLAERITHVEAQLATANLERFQKSKLLVTLVKQALQQGGLPADEDFVEALRRAHLIPLDTAKAKAHLVKTHRDARQQEIIAQLRKVRNAITTGHFADAEKPSERIQQLDPDNPTLARLLSHLELEKGRQDEISALIEQCRGLAEQDKHRELVQIAQENELAGEIKELQPLFTQARSRLKKWDALEDIISTSRKAMEAKDYLKAHFLLLMPYLQSSDENLKGRLLQEINPIEKCIRAKEAQIAARLPKDMVLVPSGYHLR